MDFAIPADHKVKLKENEKKDKYLDLAREMKKKIVEHESDGCNWYSWYSYQRTGTRTGWLGNKRTSGDHPNYCFIEIVQNTEKSPRNLRRLAVAKTPVRNQRLTPVWKTRKGVTIIIRVETVQITTLLRSVRILRRVLETWGLLSLRLQ